MKKLLLLIWAMTAAALAAVTTPAQIRGGENEEAVLEIVVDAFL